MSLLASSSYDTPHLVALFLTVVGALAFVYFLRSPRPSSLAKQRVRTAFAIILLGTVIADPLLMWHRHHLISYIIQDGLPIHLCDFVSIILAYALYTGHQRSAELGWFWGLAGTVQGLISPAIHDDWSRPEYYSFYLQHGGVPIAALGLALGTAASPQPGAWHRAMGWSLLYMLIITPVNHLIHTNYGYLARKPPVASLLDHLGPYPYYLLSMLFVAALAYALLYLPFLPRHPKTKQ